MTKTVTSTATHGGRSKYATANGDAEEAAGAATRAPRGGGGCVGAHRASSHEVARRRFRSALERRDLLERQWRTVAGSGKERDGAVDSGAPPHDLVHAADGADRRCSDPRFETDTSGASAGLPESAWPTTEAVAVLARGAWRTRERVSSRERNESGA